VPAITPAHLYTFFAMIAVCSLLIFSFTAYANALRLTSERVQLKNLMNQLAAKCTELLTLASSANASAEAYLEMPVAIGEKQYWLQLRSISSKAWIEGGLGARHIEEAELQVCFPSEAEASGYYLSGYGSASLKCYLENGIPKILLSNNR